MIEKIIRSEKYKDLLAVFLTSFEEYYEYERYQQPTTEFFYFGSKSWISVPFSFCHIHLGYITEKSITSHHHFIQNISHLILHYSKVIEIWSSYNGYYSISVSLKNLPGFNAFDRIFYECLMYTLQEGY
jgi:hypothetical protein